MLDLTPLGWVVYIAGSTVIAGLLFVIWEGVTAFGKEWDD